MVCEVCGANPRTQGVAIFTVEKDAQGRAVRRRCRVCMTKDDAAKVDPTVFKVVNAIEFGSAAPPRSESERA